MRLLAVLILAVGTQIAAQTQPVIQSPASSELHGLVHLAPEAAATFAEKRVPAVYPEKARAKGIQGTVVLDVVISELGEVKEATVSSGDPDLAQAAIEAIKQWKYKPYTVDDKPTQVETQVTFGFHIKTPPPPPPPGRFVGGKYQNEFFGISYPLSSEWVRETTLMRKKMESVEGDRSSSEVLLAALHVPSKSDGLVADSSLVVVATPGQGDAKQCLTDTVLALEAQKVAKHRGEIEPLTIVGLTAYRADFKPTNGDAQYQSIVCTMAKGYSLRWNVLAISESALDDAVGTVAAITTYEAGPAGVSVLNPSKPTASPDAPEPFSATRMRVSSSVTAGLLIRKVEPRYPEGAKSAHIQGTVLLHAVIDKAGNVIDLEAIAGPVELIPTTVNAVRQWKYKPYLLKGEPIELDTTVEVRYTLGG